MGSFLFYSTTTSIQSVEENCTHDHSYYVKNTSVAKNCTDHSYVKHTSVTKIPVIDHSMGDHSYADVVKFGDKHQNKHVRDHSYMHALWRKVVLFIIKIMKNQLSPIPKLNKGIKRIV